MARLPSCTGSPPQVPLFLAPALAQSHIMTKPDPKLGPTGNTAECAMVPRAVAPTQGKTLALAALHVTASIA